MSGLPVDRVFTLPAAHYPISISAIAAFAAALSGGWSDCLCLPSTDRTESFGMVLLEAMSVAKACVVSDVEGSGMSWLVEDGKTGLVAPTQDINGLAEALCLLRDDPELAATLGQNGRQKFLAALTIEASAEGIRNLYHQLPSVR